MSKVNLIKSIPHTHISSFSFHLPRRPSKLLGQV